MIYVRFANVRPSAYITGLTYYLIMLEWPSEVNSPKEFLVDQNAVLFCARRRRIIFAFFLRTEGKNRRRARIQRSFSGETRRRSPRRSRHS